MIRYVLIFCLLFVIGCGRFGMMDGIEQHPEGAWGYFFGNSDPDWDFWDDPLRQRQQCKNLKEGEQCMDLTKRMGGLEGTIFKDLKPIRGWKQTGCVHSKQVPGGFEMKEEFMYCEYCQGKKQMWMIYDYDWEGKYGVPDWYPHTPENSECGDPPFVK